MELVNSKEKLLKGPEIVAQSAYNMPDLKYPKEVVLAAVAAEFTLPRTDLVQIGNTVFVAHTGKGKNKKKMVGRAFNVDTGRNLLLMTLSILRTYSKKASRTIQRSSTDLCF